MMKSNWCVLWIVFMISGAVPAAAFGQSSTRHFPHGESIAQAPPKATTQLGPTPYVPGPASHFPTIFGDGAPPIGPPGAFIDDGACDACGDVCGGTCGGPCDDLACGGCGGAGCDDCCGWCLPCFCGWEIFGEYILMRPRNVEIAYGVPFDTPRPAGEPPVQLGPTGIVDPGHNSGFRAGVGIAFNKVTTLRAQFTQLDSDVTDTLNGDPGAPIFSLVSHPTATMADTGFLSATATNRVKFEFIDIDLRRVLWTNSVFAADWVAGVRYARLEQDFLATFSNLNTEAVHSGLDFDGAGFRIGIEGDKWGPLGFSVYGKSYANFLAGQFRGHYIQSSTFAAATPTVQTTWQGDRIVTILEAEVGLAWTSYRGFCRINAGYMFNGWFNAVRNESFINAVKQNNFIDLSEGLGFDGFNVRAELRF